MFVQQHRDQENLAVHQRHSQDPAVRPYLDFVDRTPFELPDSFCNAAEVLYRSNGHGIRLC